MHNEIYDVIVVGAGPAGSTAAYYLGKNPRLKVLIVDRFEFPRYKSCAGGLLLCEDWPAEFENFAAAGADINGFPCHDFNFYYDKIHWYHTPNTHLHDIVDRAEFDHTLLKEALKLPNIRFKRYNVDKIHEVRNNEGSFYCLASGTEELFAKNIIGADGFRGVVCRFLGNGPARTREYGRCLQYDLTCQHQNPATTSVFLNWAGQLGFSWIFPNQHGYSLGIGFIGKTDKPLVKILDHFFEYAISCELIPAQYIKKRVSGALCPAFVVERFCNEHVLLCGDSLGVVRQHTGEGIYYAMKTGKIAAECVLNKGASLPRQYRAALKPVFREITLLRRFPPVPISKFLLRLGMNTLSCKLPFGMHIPIRRSVVDIFHRMNSLPKYSKYA
jgi:menaquinone-9 beta-reductase